MSRLGQFVSRMGLAAALRRASEHDWTPVIDCAISKNLVTRWVIPLLGPLKVEHKVMILEAMSSPVASPLEKGEPKDKDELGPLFGSADGIPKDKDDAAPSTLRESDGAQLTQLMHELEALEPLDLRNYLENVETPQQLESLWAQMVASSRPPLLCVCVFCVLDCETGLPRLDHFALPGPLEVCRTALWHSVGSCGAIRCAWRLLPHLRGR